MKNTTALLFAFVALLAGCSTTPKPPALPAALKPKPVASVPKPPAPPALPALPKFPAPLSKLKTAAPAVLPTSKPAEMKAVTITNAINGRLYIVTYWVPKSMVKLPIIKGSLMPPVSKRAMTLSIVPAPDCFDSYLDTEPPPYAGTYFVSDWMNIPTGSKVSAQVTSTLGDAASWITVASTTWTAPPEAIWGLVILADKNHAFVRLVLNP